MKSPNTARALVNCSTCCGLNLPTSSPFLSALLIV